MLWIRIKSPLGTAIEKSENLILSTCFIFLWGKEWGLQCVLLPCPPNFCGCRISVFSASMRQQVLMQGFVNTDCRLMSSLCYVFPVGKGNNDCSWRGRGILWPLFNCSSFLFLRKASPANLIYLEVLAFPWKESGTPPKGDSTTTNAATKSFQFMLAQSCHWKRGAVVVSCLVTKVIWV